jgi:hypothetical protein
VPGTGGTYRLRQRSAMAFRRENSSLRVALFFNNLEGKAFAGLDESPVDVGLSCILSIAFEKGAMVGANTLVTVCPG